MYRTQILKLLGLWLTGPNIQYNFFIQLMVSAPIHAYINTVHVVTLVEADLSLTVDE